MLAGLIRDDERKVLVGHPRPERPAGDRPALRPQPHRDAETDIILTLTPHIVRVLDLTEADLRPFRVGRDTGSAAPTRRADAAAAPRAARGERRAPPRRAQPAPPARRRHAGRRRRPRRRRPPRPLRSALRPPARRARRAPAGAPRAGRSRARPSRAAPAGSGRRRPAPRQSAPCPTGGRGCRAAVPRSLRRSGDDDAMRIAEEQIRAHPAQLLEREQTQLVHPVVDQRRALGLRREHGHQADEVAREARPQAGRDAAGRRSAVDGSTRSTSSSMRALRRPAAAAPTATTSMSTARAPRTSISPPVIAATTAQLPASM